MDQPKNRGTFTLYVLTVAMIAIACPAICLADPSSWLIGDQLQQSLEKRIGITWTNIPLRQAIDRLSHLQRIAVTLDRRIDPNQKIELKFDDVTLKEALQRVASRLGVGVTMLGPVVYFGPKSTTDRLRTVAAMRSDDVKRLPIGDRSRWTQSKSLKWDEATAPRELVSELVRSTGVGIDAISQIPADLWAAGDLPALSLTDQLTLLLAQFNLTFELSSDGRTIRLIPLPEKPQIERSYAAVSAQDAMAKLRQQPMLHNTDIRMAASRVVVSGTQEEQDIVSELLSGRTAGRTTVNEGKKVYTLQIPIEKPVGKLLEQLGPALNVQIHMNADAIKAAGLSLDTLVKIDVKDASADELLKSILQPAGLTFRRQGDVIEIAPK